MKDVSVIIINYNNAKYTLECIEAVREKTAPGINYEIIVIDNASEALDLNVLKNGFPEADNIHLYPSDVNTGFGGGNMHGFQHANGRYSLFLNNDAKIRMDQREISWLR